MTTINRGGGTYFLYENNGLVPTPTELKAKTNGSQTAPVDENVDPIVGGADQNLNPQLKTSQEPEWMRLELKPAETPVARLERLAKVAYLKLSSGNQKLATEAFRMIHARQDYMLEDKNGKGSGGMTFNFDGWNSPLEETEKPVAAEIKRNFKDIKVAVVAMVYHALVKAGYSPKEIFAGEGFVRVTLNQDEVI